MHRKECVRDFVTDISRINLVNKTQDKLKIDDPFPLSIIDVKDVLMKLIGPCCYI